MAGLKIGKQQAKEFAYMIAEDIRQYVTDHQTEYLAFLREHENCTTKEAISKEDEENEK